ARYTAAGFARACSPRMGHSARPPLMVLIYAPFRAVAPHGLRRAGRARPCLPLRARRFFLNLRAFKPATFFRNPYQFGPPLPLIERNDLSGGGLRHASRSERNRCPPLAAVGRLSARSPTRRRPTPEPLRHPRRRGSAFH